MPVAVDLHFLLSVPRVVPELERSHDLVVDVARASRPHPQSTLAAHPGAGRADAQACSRHVARGRPTPGTSATGRPRTSSARRDDEIYELHASLIAEIASGDGGPVTMEMTVLARCYERLGTTP